MYYKLEMYGPQPGAHTASVYDDKNIAILRSYSTIVAVYCKKSKRAYVRSWYSATTSRHVSRFLQQYDVAETYRKGEERTKYNSKKTDNYKYWEDMTNRYYRLKTTY